MVGLIPEKRSSWQDTDNYTKLCIAIIKSIQKHQNSESKEPDKNS